MCLGWQRKNQTLFHSPDEPFIVVESQEPDQDSEFRFAVPEDDPWDAFVPDDDHEPLPEPGDFWCEDE